MSPPPNEEDFKGCFDQASIGMCIATLGGSLVYGNRLFQTLTKYSPQELGNLSIFNITAQDELAFAFEHLNSFLSESSTGPKYKSILLKSSFAGLSLQIQKLSSTGTGTSDGGVVEGHQLLVSLVPSQEQKVASSEADSTSSSPKLTPSAFYATG